MSNKSIEAEQAGDDQRLIRELALIYDEIPEFKDVYVEGPFDAKLISWFLKSHGRKNQVFPIKLVYVPTQEVLARGLEDGAKGRLLTFGALLEKELFNLNSSMPVIIVDKDRDALFPPATPVCKSCLYTDYTSIEIYGYEVEVVEKLLDLFLHVESITAREVLNLIEPILVDLFLLRAALHMSGTGVGLIEGFTGHCGIASGRGQVDMANLLSQSMADYSKRFRPRVETIIEEVENLRKRLPSDVRLAIRGHDFIQVLSWVLNGHVEGMFRNIHVIARGLILALEKVDLLKYPLFIELLKRTSPPSSGSSTPSPQAVNSPALLHSPPASSRRHASHTTS